MEALLNGLMVPLMFLGRIWMIWAVGTFCLVLASWGGSILVGSRADGVWKFWRDYGLLGPPRLMVHLLGGKEKKKARKGGRH